MALNAPIFTKRPILILLALTIVKKPILEFSPITTSLPITTHPIPSDTFLLILYPFNRYINFLRNEGKMPMVAICKTGILFFGISTF